MGLVLSAQNRDWILASQRLFGSKREGSIALWSRYVVSSAQLRRAAELEVHADEILGYIRSVEGREEAMAVMVACEQDLQPGILLRKGPHGRCDLNSIGR